MTDSVTTHDGMIRVLRAGERVSFDEARRIEAFQGVYAWWAMEDSPPPINPTIPPIKAGECVRVGATGIFGNGRPQTARLRTNCRWLPTHLSCYSAGSGSFGIFPTKREAKPWCRRALVVAYWHSPEGWTGANVQRAEQAAIAMLQPYCDRHIRGGRADHPRCPQCGSVIGRTQVAQKSIAPHPCPQCGWRQIV